VATFGFESIFGVSPAPCIPSMGFEFMREYTMKNKNITNKMPKIMVLDGGNFILYIL
jgi:hypothetical protein